MIRWRLEFRDIAWRYWLVSWALIVSGLAGWERGFYFVTALAAFQVLHFAVWEKSAVTLPVQVRVAAFLLFAVALWPPLRFLYWIPSVCLVARILINYCLMARLVSLLPWNRTGPFTWDLVRRRLLTPPTQGSILDSESS